MTTVGSKRGMESSERISQSSLCFLPSHLSYKAPNQASSLKAPKAADVVLWDQAQETPASPRNHRHQKLPLTTFFYKIKLFPSFPTFPALQFRALAGREMRGIYMVYSCCWGTSLACCVASSPPQKLRFLLSEVSTCTWRLETGAGLAARAALAMVRFSKGLGGVLLGGCVAFQ